LGVPAVDLLGMRPCAGIPQVFPDQEAIVRAAIDHLVARGLRHLAYVGYRDVNFSETRCDAFLRYAKEQGCTTAVFQEGRLSHAISLAGVEEKTLRRDTGLAAWLAALPKPAGLVACNDMRACQILSVCGERGIAVPDAIAVVGVDNDPLLCKLSDPPLSSVDPRAQRIGYEAAALLHRMIEGQQHVPAMTLVEPGAVVCRRSTDMLAIASADVVGVLRHIREHACDGLSMEMLIGQMAVSRRTLERWFSAHVGHSPCEEITRVKLDRVKELLVTTNLSAEEIANLAGFAYMQSMHRLFTHRFGQTPGGYRAAHQRPGQPG
jgi:LacI family transcriptional regulator